MASVTSPCIKLCVLDVGGAYCTGCARTPAEIGAWSALSEGQRRAVLAALPERRQRLGLPPASARRA